MIPVASGAGWVFAKQQTYITAHYESAALPTLFVRVETEGSWRRFPPVDQHETVLILTKHESVVVQTQLDPPVHTRFRVDGILAEHDMRIAQRMDAATESEIATALRSALESGGDEDLFDVHMQSIWSLLQAIETARRSGTLHHRLFETWSDGVLGHFAGGGSVSSERSMLRYLFYALLTTVTVALCVRFVHRRYGTASSWRRPHDNEWAEVQPQRDRVLAGRADA